MNHRQIVNIDEILQKIDDHLTPKEPVEIPTEIPVEATPEATTEPPVEEPVPSAIPEVQEDESTSYVKQDAFGNKTFSMIERYGENYCKKEYITNPAIGRDREIKELILILLTPEKSGILTGKPGIGKTSIVEGLAYRIQRGEVPDALKGYTIINIKTPSLLGSMPNGESRIQTLIDELKTMEKVILFIDEIHMLIGATDESSRKD